MATITEIASTNGNFDILASLLTAASLAATFDDAADGPDAFTVFAPTDAAFGALALSLGFAGDDADAEAVVGFLFEALADLGDGDPLPLLTTILAYHVSPGGKTLAEVAALSEVETLAGAAFAPGPHGTLIDGDPDAPDPALALTDVLASNGVAHVIDGVLLPLDAPTFAVRQGDDGRDVLTGEAGADNLLGGAGSDILRGRDGDDILSGGGAADAVFGGTGDDVLTGGAGADLMLGGRGADDLSGDGGSDKLHGNRGGDVIVGGEGADLIAGDRGADALSGDEGRDVLRGGRGADDLSGGAGHDVLRGGRGDDTLDGGAGSDAMRGGDGADVFVYAEGSGRDLIVDFAAGVDGIDLTDFGLADFEAFEALGAQRGRGAVFDFGDGDALALIGVGIDDLSASDVII